MPVLTFKTEAEWLAIRESYIGGSEIAALFYEWELADGTTTILHMFEVPPEGAVCLGSLLSYTSGFRLLHEKAGTLPSSFKNNERVEAGNHLEPAIAAWAMSKWPEWKLRKVRRYLTHAAVPGWGSSLDYELANGVPVEVKNVDGLIFRDKWKGEPDDDVEGLVPPIHINLQLQHQIGCTKADHGFVVVMIAGNRLERVRVDRHEPTQARIAEAVSMFWQALKDGVMPLWLADLDTVKDRGKSGDSLLAAVDLTGDESAMRDARRYMRWTRHEKYVGKTTDAIKARLGYRMGDATKALVGPLVAAWPMSGRPAKLIPEKWQDAATWRGGFSVKPAPPPKPEPKAKTPKVAK